ncbi:MAG: SulP family inorganic anion transporter [Thermodesulfobacteriota bacterium]
MMLVDQIKARLGIGDQWSGEVWGGFASMLVALPSSIAYGIAIYAVLGSEYVAYGVIAGILGAIAMGILAPLLGGAPGLISAPCAPAAAVMGALAAEMIKSANVSPPQVLVFLTLVALFSGALQLVYGALGGGRFIKYIPYPVVSGYLSGVGVLIFIGQLPKLLGLPNDIPVWQGLASPGNWQWTGIVVGLVTIAGVVAGPRLTKTVPATIMGVAAGFLAYFGLSYFLPELRTLEHNKLVIGRLFSENAPMTAALEERWAALGAVRFSDLANLFMPAITLSVLLSIDTLKTCVVMDTLTHRRHNSNRELIGQGVANFASALMGGIPGAGTMGATLVNVSSGGKTRLSGVLEGVFVIVAFVAFAWLICWLPIAALAGILMVVAWRMFDRSSFLLLKQKTTVFDFLVIAAVVATAIGVNLIAAAGVGLLLAILLFIREQIRGSVIRRKVFGNQISSKQYRVPEEKEILQTYGHLITVCELQGNLFFGTTDQLFTELEPDLKRSRFLILDLRRVQSVDFTAVHMLEQIEAILKERGGHLVLSHLPPSVPTGQDLTEYFDHLGLVKAGRNVSIFLTFDEALQWAEDQFLEEYRQAQSGQELPLELPEIELLREFEADQALPIVQSCVEQRAYSAGQRIFSKEDEGDELFIIRRGIVRIVLPLENDRYHILAIFGRGNFFGEIAFLDRGKRSADAVADKDTDLFVISRKKFDEASKTNPIVGVKLFARLARGLAIRLRYTDAELRALKEA